MIRHSVLAVLAIAASHAARPEAPAISGTQFDVISIKRHTTGTPR